MTDPATAAPPTVYSARFWTLSASIFLFFLSFNLIIPELPAYLDRLGGGDYKGWIIGLFTISAGLSRPFSGKLADRIGRRPIIFAGIVVSTACVFVYPAFETVALFLALRLLHGFSTGFTPTGASAYLADIVPPDRRGEAMGIYGTLSGVGMAFGPALGSWLASYWSLAAMFYVSGGLGLASLAITFSLRETLPQPQPLKLAMLRLQRHELLEINALPPALVYGLCYFSYGAILTLVPDFSVALGINNKGLFNTTFTLTSIAVRFFAGRSSDHYGRAAVLKVAALLYVAAMLGCALAQHPVSFFAAAAVYGLGLGALTPAVMAWTIDLSHDQNRGRALSTMYIALEMGIGLGAFAAGAIYANQTARMPWVFGLSAGLAGLAWAYLVGRRK
ncbi:MAG: MFS transporter [Bernardetiaceae bacterium]|jgi:MFS family permease|nr:MFS transporter [Bernardetiaceae bacterium]